MANKFEFNSCPNKGSKINMSIWDGIEEYEDYEDLLKYISKIGSDDHVTLNISSPGGRCDIGFMLIERLSELSCQVDVVVPYPSYSMGALLALCGDSLTIKPGAFIMFHDYSTGHSRSKGNEIFKQTEAYKEAFEYKFNKVCQPFLTKKECQDILNGQDFYVKWNDKTLKDRVKRHFK